MKFNEFVKTALSNDIVCIVDNIINGNIIAAPEAAFRFIDGIYADKEIDRFTLGRRIDGVNGHMIYVKFK